MTPSYVKAAGEHQPPHANQNAQPFIYGLLPPVELDPELLDPELLGLAELPELPELLGLAELPELLGLVELPELFFDPYEPPCAPEGSLTFEPDELLLILVEVLAPEGSFIVPRLEVPSFPSLLQPTSNATALANTSIFFIIAPSHQPFHRAQMPAIRRRL